MKLSDYLKNARLNKGLTISEFAKVLNITAPTLCNLENGKASPSVTTLNKIAMYFKISNKKVREMLLNEN